ncbi:DUF2530 domain-containing protein [Nocardioides gilvus]|uniref:DUF2530 domain-containing protein n=1 Tax=Nocardioides gilvus TaxID=1735589 RepID=UPI001EF43916|nr:DUF2530 domain-containing protein [Nocardioides gilvus]
MARSESSDKQSRRASGGRRASAPVRRPAQPRGTFTVADVQPFDVDGVRAVGIGTVMWGVAFVALLPFYGSLNESGRVWWLWTCAAGVSLGLFGLEYCRRRRDRDPSPEVAPTPPGSGAGRRRLV